MRRRTAAAAIGALLAACTSGPPRAPPPPDPDLRIWSPGVVHWLPGTERSIRFAIENGTQRTISVPQPDPAGARVSVFGEAEAPACALDPSRPTEGPAGAPVTLSPGDQLIVTVDLSDACGSLPAGEYRFELGYRLPPSNGKAGVTLLTRYGTLVVEGRGPGAVPRTGGTAGRPPERH
jgi:hypothetical protein